MKQFVSARAVFASLACVFLLGGIFLACQGAETPTAPEDPTEALPTKSSSAEPSEPSGAELGSGEKTGGDLDQVVQKAKGPKVDVCHQKGNGSYHIINVAEASVPAHESHGDWRVADEVCDGVDNDCDGEVDEGGDALCDNNDVCDGQETCGGVDSCQPGTPLDPDDGNACTADSCDPATGVSNDPIDPDDSNACTADTCDPATGVSNDPIDPDDSNACTADTCDPATGVSNDPIDPDDGDVCTVDSCDSATGVSNDPIDPDDGNTCTADTCDPTTGVSNDPVSDGTTCDDGDPGTANDVCTDGVCAGVASGCPECQTTCSTVLHTDPSCCTGWRNGFTGGGGVCCKPPPGCAGCNTSCP